MEVKLVQELAESGQGPPDPYILRDDDRPIAASPVASTVPVIDLHRLLRADGCDEAEKLRSALQSWGIFQAIGHEMPASFLEDVQDIARKFFQLPVEVKQKYSNLTENGEFKLEGYGNDSKVSGQTLDWNDRLYLQVQPEDERNLELWPEDPSYFRDILHEYTMKARKVVEHVLFAMAKLLALENDYFINQLGDRAGVYARFNYYPCCSKPDLVFGIKPHADGSAITVLLPDKEVDGLQVLKDGEWVKIPIIPHALLLNLGNQMEIMSNGIFKSPVHRVVANSKERMSLAMFYSLEPEQYLEPAKALIDENRPRLYKKMRTKDFLSAYFQKFSQGKLTIDCAKI